jgi:hypothetical protein
MNLLRSLKWCGIAGIAQFPRSLYRAAEAEARSKASNSRNRRALSPRQLGYNRA